MDHFKFFGEFILNIGNKNSFSFEYNKLESNEFL